jgi:DNA-binding transcriptional LysR family regulator
MGALPIATSIGGQFREQVDADAEKAKWTLNIELSCSSFTQAARAVASGGYAGVLPDVASAQFDDTKVGRFALPFLKGYVRPLVLAWNPRTANVREIVPTAKDCLVRLLR